MHAMKAWGNSSMGESAEQQNGVGVSIITVA